MSKSKKNITIVCPSCEERIYFSKWPKLGDIVICHYCKETHIITQDNPPKVKWLVFENDSYWDDKDLIDYNDPSNYHFTKHGWD